MKELTNTIITTTVYNWINYILSKYVTLTVCGVVVDPMLILIIVLLTVLIKPTVRTK
ncbi:hypothetical protein PAV_14c00150 [Paenibacillus alvei DSM 29]|nr:hypothetical protein PAV_14c00150 [Paenibacillus alvei DSM 29]